MLRYGGQRSQQSGKVLGIIEHFLSIFVIIIVFLFGESSAWKSKKKLVLVWLRPEWMRP